ncbi:divalent-cation tolerance protein CutA [Aeromonas caviae]|uniref:divalent-cation tolerance protein CutA n=1 Tax=Aeromonas caviae TaxID=648 RepID=UPI002B4A4003|nr:divalent-cation tolerance protein CutA [Aeromonas caviae]
MTDAILVLCTCPDETSADRLCEQLLDQHLAACINQLPGVTSVYRWQGKTERTREIQLVIKSRATLFEPLRQCILAHHPYEVPEILALPASQGHPAYLDWLTQETS